MRLNENIIPSYEEQQFINPGIEQIQEILSKFNQLVPNGFIKVKLEEGNYCGSTNPKWKNKPLSERYFFICEEKEIQIDIPHTLMEELGLEKEEDIPQPLYLDPKVLTRPETYRGITIENEEEIFLVKPFTIQNLEQNLNKLFQQIKDLEKEQEKNQITITNLKNQLSEKEKNKDDWKNEWLTEWRKNNTLTTERNNLQQTLNTQQAQISNLQNQTTHLNHTLQTTQQSRNQIQANLKRSLIISLFKNQRINELNNCLSFLRGLLVNKHQEVTNLTNQRNNLQGQLNQAQIERDDYQNKWDVSLEDLERKEEIIRSYLQQLNLKDVRINELEREKEQELTQKDNEITELKRQIERIEAERDSRPNITLTQWNGTQQELDREKNWLDKWINDEIKDKATFDILREKLHRVIRDINIDYYNEKHITSYSYPLSPATQDEWDTYSVSIKLVMEENWYTYRNTSVAGYGDNHKTHVDVYLESMCSRAWIIPGILSLPIKKSDEGIKFMKKLIDGYYKN